MSAPHRFVLGDLHGYTVAIKQDHESAEVWLDTEVEAFDGLCIGLGPTRQAAIDDALRVLRYVSECLEVGR